MGESTKDAESSGPRRRSPVRLVLEPVAIVAATLLVLAVIAEGALRLAYPMPPILEGRLDVRGLVRLSSSPETVWELAPGVDKSIPGMAVHTSSAGLRDREYTVTRPSDVRRIAFMGDSVVFGYGVSQEDTAPKALERMLNERNRTTRYEVMNFGVPGYNTEQEYVTLRDRVLAYHPDIVVLGFVMNDGVATPRVSDASVQDLVNQGADDGGLLQFPGKRFIREHSYLYQFSARRFETLREKLKLSAAPKYYYDDVQGLVSPQNPEEETPNWKRARNALGQFSALLREKRIPFVLVVFPSQNQLRAEASRQRNEDVLDALRTPQRRLAAFARDSDAVLVDLTQAFDGFSRAQPLYTDTFSSHPNALGHKIAAMAILDALSQRSLAGFAN